MLGFQSRYPEAPCPHFFDMGLDPQFRKLMAQFCRTSARTLRSLDLGARLPGPGRVLIRSFRTPPLRCPRLRVKRLGYSFCPTCISEQRYVHVRWDWTLPVLLRCHLHQIPLMHGCPVCDDDDPLPFGADSNITPILCSNCGADLTGANPDSNCSQVGAAQIVIEKLYRDALYGRSSRVALLQKATGIQFRRFVDDIFQLLCWYPELQWAHQWTFSPFSTSANEAAFSEHAVQHACAASSGEDAAHAGVDGYHARRTIPAPRRSRFCSLLAPLGNCVRR
jgi:hypothetical protein